jgi:Flp pilus assembly protein TadG
MARKNITMQRIQDVLRQEKGASIVMVAVLMTVIMGFSAIAFDISAVYTKKAAMQRSADAGALAGAVDFALNKNESLARLVTKNYFDINNGMAELDQLADIQITAQGNLYKVAVDKTLTQEYRLAKFLGINRGDVRVRAAATVTPVTLVNPMGGGGVMPWGVYPQVLNAGYGNLVELKEGSPIDSGWFGCLALNGPGANEYRDGIENGCSVIVRVGDIVTPKDGNNSGPTSQGVGSRKAGHEACTYLNCEKNCPRLVMVPVLNPNGNWEIIGFGQFFLEDVLGSGNSNIVTGRFVRNTLNSAAAAGASDGNDYGAMVINMVE